LSNYYYIDVDKIFRLAEIAREKRENAKQSVAAKDANSDINRVVNSDAAVRTGDTQQSVTAAHQPK